jgi:apolipoprotein N-acyltransferase
MPLGILLAALSGCLVFLSFPPFDLFPLQWLSLVPLLIAVRGRTFRGGFFLGFVAGVVNNFGGFHWISDLLREFGHMEPPAAWGLTFVLALYQGLVCALATGFSARITSRLAWPWWIVFPILYTTAEYVVPFLFPWYFGNGQLLFTAAIQIVEITGVSGLTLLIVLFNAALAEIFRARIEKRSFPWVPTVLAGLLFLGNVGWGVWRIVEVDRLIEQAPKFRVGMVEADVGIWEKEARGDDGVPLPAAQQVRKLYKNLLKHQILSARLEQESKPDLIVWPESSYMPLHQVLSRRSDREVVAVQRDGRMARLVADEVEPVDDQGAGDARASGLRAVAALSENGILAVGPRGTVMRFDGKDWVREPTGLDRDLLAVAFKPDGTEALAVGIQGAAAIRRSGEWSPVELGTTADLRGVTWAPGRGWVVAGDRGTLFAWTGRSSEPLVEGHESTDWKAVSARDGATVWAVGTGGVVARIGLSGRVLIETPVKATLRGVAAGATTWVVGDAGTIVECRHRCEPVPSGVRHDLLAVTGDGGYRAWAAGTGETILALDGRNLSVRTTIPGAGRHTTGLSWLPLVPGYPLPRDARHIYVSHASLPAGADLANLEAAVDADADTPPRDRNAAMRGFSTPLLFGALTREPGDEPDESRDFNTALLLDPEGRVKGRYDKVFLLLFGEYMPFSGMFPFLKQWFPEAADFTPGSEPGMMTLGDARMGLLICYEDILPRFVRKTMDLDPNVLVNVTNDAWFGKTSEPFLHFQLAAFRTVEHRRYLVRSTNTGVSAFVDPVGRILQQTSLDDPEILVADVPLMTERTLYARFGDIVAWACCGIGLILVLVAGLRRKR